MLYHDEYAAESTLAFFLSRMRHPYFPEPVGVFRAIQKKTYDDMLEQSMIEAKEARAKSLQELLNEGETWTVT